MTAAQEAKLDKFMDNVVELDKKVAVLTQVIADMPEHPVTHCDQNSVRLDSLEKSRDNQIKALWGLLAGLIASLFK